MELWTAAMAPAIPPGCLFAGMLKKKSPKALLGARWQKRYGIGDKMKTSNSCVRLVHLHYVHVHVPDCQKEEDLGRCTMRER